jgi:hypothetical protein
MMELERAATRITRHPRSHAIEKLPRNSSRNAMHLVAGANFPLHTAGI